MNRKLFEKRVWNLHSGLWCMRLPVKDGAIHRRRFGNGDRLPNGITYSTPHGLPRRNLRGLSGQALTATQRKLFTGGQNAGLGGHQWRIGRGSTNSLPLPGSYFDFTAHALGEVALITVSRSAPCFSEKMRARANCVLSVFPSRQKREFGENCGLLSWDFRADPIQLHRRPHQDPLPLTKPLNSAASHRRDGTGGGRALAQLRKSRRHPRGYRRSAALPPGLCAGVASQPGVKVLLSGMSDMGQLKDNIRHPVRTGRPSIAAEQDVLAGRPRRCFPTTPCLHRLRLRLGMSIRRRYSKSVRIYNNRTCFQTNSLPQEYFISWSGNREDHCRQCGACLPGVRTYDIPAAGPGDGALFASG